MRKILSILVVALLIGGGLAYADGIAYTRGAGDRILTEVFEGSGDVASSIDTSNIILGFSVSDSSAALVGLYDQTSTTASASNLFAEGYVAAGTSLTIFFPLPKALTTGLMVSGQNTTTVTIVYYE